MSSQAGLLRLNRPGNPPAGVILWLILVIVIGPARVCGQSGSQLERLRVAERRVLQRVERLRAATVAVKLGAANASGFVVEGGFVLTSAHATNRLGQPATVLPLVGEERSAMVHAIDQTTDVALLKLDDATGLTTVTLQPTALARPTAVIAIGNPGGFEKKRASLLRFGTASGGEVLQSTCRIARGDSGGPLFDLGGRVVGIHQHIRAGVAENYHTPAASVLKHWETLVAGGVITGAPARAKPSTMDQCDEIVHTASRSVVQVFTAGQPMLLGTVIDQEKGLIVTKASDLVTPVKVGVGKVRRAAKVIRTDLATDLGLLKVKGGFESCLPPRQNGRVMKAGDLVLTALPDLCRVGMLGAGSREIRSQRGELGLLADEDLRVERVQPNSAARAVGIRVGDRIVGVGQQGVKNTAQLSDALRPFNPGDTFPLQVARSGKDLLLRIRMRHPAGSRFDDKTFQMGAGGVSSQRRSGFPLVLQHDCLVSAKQCGSPVVNLDGTLVGINIAKVGREAVYCVPTRLIHEFVSASSPDRTGTRDSP